MGFLADCSKALLSFLYLSTGSDRLSQQPLLFPGIAIEPESASPGFKCEYPSLKGWKSCNEPNRRDCWLKDTSSAQPLFSQYDIHTDYEKSWPQGIHREFWLDIEDKTISPDGYLKPEGKVVNGSYPGPLIEACWGDDITVHVRNQVKTNGTTIHWHGLRQLHTNEADGVNGVTQCPIATGSSYTYNFKALQYGHSWYHSHYSLQYPDGVAGPMVIHGPSSANWDEAWDPILISDWNHDSAFAAFQTELDALPPFFAPFSDSIVLNGTGNFTQCNTTDPRCLPESKRKPIFSKVFQKGKRYLLRLINASTASDFVFTIDNHILEVISTDYVPIHPFKTDSIHIGIGQRYSVIVEANPSAPAQKDGNYWIRTIVSDGCGLVHDNVNQTGVIRYDSKSTALPTSKINNNVNTTCADEPVENLVPVVPWVVDRQAVNNVPEYGTFEVGRSVQNVNETHGYVRWEITDTPLWLNFSDPTILNLHNKTFNNQYAVVSEDYSHGFVYLIITAQPTFKDNKTLVPAAHPIHLHGHDFVILGQGSSTYDVANTPKTFKYNNPPRRDVALLPQNGYLAIAFRPDNPGVWLVHCHIAWHASSGLAMQIMERQSEIEKTIPSLAPTRETCKGWDTWFAEHVSTFNQDDSGI